MFLDIHGFIRSAQTAGTVLGFSSGICMNDTLNIQQTINMTTFVKT